MSDRARLLKVYEVGLTQGGDATLALGDTDYKFEGGIAIMVAHNKAEIRATVPQAISINELGDEHFHPSHKFPQIAIPVDALGECDHYGECKS